MKIYKYTAMALNANIDPYLVYNNICDNYEDVSYYNPFNNTYMGKKDDPALHPLDGLKVNKLFSGNTITKLDGIDCKIQLDVNIEIFSERAVSMFEYVFDIKNKQAFDVMIKKLNDNFIFEEILSWKTGNEMMNCSIINFSVQFIIPLVFSKKTPKIIVNNIAGFIINFCNLYSIIFSVLDASEFLFTLV